MAAPRSADPESVVAAGAVPSQRALGRGRGRPRGSRPAADRDQIIAAAVRAVRRVGPDVTMDEIAAEAGVTKPIIYRTVGDKAAIGLALAEYLSLQVEAAGFEASACETDPERRFMAAVRSVFEYLAEEQALFLFVEQGWGSADGSHTALLIERAAQPFIDGFAESADGAAHPPEAVRTWAYATVGSLRTVANMWVRDRWCTLDELVEHATTFSLRPYPQPTDQARNSR
ncbi:MAG: TetR/AcrR family transcriptional regulator [Acidimicrobiales bacterium]